MSRIKMIKKKTPRAYLLQSLLLPLFAVLIIALTLTSCAGTPERPPQLMPHFKDLRIVKEGYWAEGKHAVYETADFMVSIHSLAPNDHTGSSLLDTLKAKGFIVFKMEILNTTSDEDITYSPSHTSLHDNKLGFRKPLNLTDLYGVAIGIEQEGKLKSELRGMYYDRNETVLPGKSVSKFLIFKPLRKNAKKVKLDIKLLFVGNEASNILFPFKYTDSTEPLKDHWFSLF